MPRAKSHESRESQQDRLLLAILPLVEELGWSEEAILAGAEEAGIDESRALSLFAEGPDEVIHHFMDWADRAMLQALDKKKLARLRTPERVKVAIQTRLDLLADYRPAVAASVVHELKHFHAPDALRALYRTVDAIWIAAGDTATDFNFYTKRMLLAGVYTTTLACWLRDDSDDFERTWAFLDRRLDNVMKFGKFTGQLKARFSGVKSFADKVRRKRAA